MAFCTIGNEYIKTGYTQIDNVFMGGYLPQADATDCKVYLYGLFLASSGDTENNSPERIALALRISEERVMQAFEYWATQGLIMIGSTSPVTITYMSVKLPLLPIIKVNAKEYSVFIEELARLYPEKILTENELMSYIELMKTYKIDTNAMLMIVTYCMNLKGSASTPYVLAVATDWAKQGIVSESAVASHISELECQCEGITQIYATLGLKSKPSLDDRQFYLTWTKDYGYTLDAILTATRACKKRGGLTKLIKFMEELHSAGAISAQEIDSYCKQKEASFTLAEDIARNIGTYFGSYDAPVEVYITPWLNKGFEPDALRLLAKFCFIRNVHSLEGLQSYVDKFYKLGILTAEGIQAYSDKQIAIDGLIKEVLSACGNSSFVSNRDRDFYRTFVDSWGFSHQTILVVAEYVSGNPFPMASINRMLATMKNVGIYDPEEAKRFLNMPKTNMKATTENYEKRDYTKEQLNAISHSLDELGEDGGEL